MPGYVRYCPYTRDPSAAGTYNGPDLARARRLVRESGQAAEPVSSCGAAADATAIPPAEPAYIARVLRSLGFEANVRLRRASAIHEDDRRSFQISVDGDWLLDFPSAASFLPQFFG